MREYSEDSDIRRGVRQGCCISPMLFNIYAEAMMTEAMEGIEEETKVGDVRTGLMQQLRTLE